MTSLTLYTKLETLPSDLKKEAKDFIESLVKRHDPAYGNEKKTPVFGSLKGKISLGDDFDEPLELFNDYM